jgi:pyruvate carboxylase subunit B
VRYHVSVAGRTFEIDFEGTDVIVDGTAVEAQLAALPGTPIRHLRSGGIASTWLVAPGDRRGEWELQRGGERFSVEALDERTRAIREMAGGEDVEAEKTVVAPMPGLVLRLEVAEGDQVVEGQGVVVVEAMKMENELKAPADGTVTRISVSAGDTVEKGATLVVLE